MTGEGAVAGAAIVGNRQPVVGPDYVDIEVHQALSSDVGRIGAHAVGGVADGTGKSVLRNVRVVLDPAGVGQYLRQIVALGAHGIRAIHAEVGIGKSIGDESPGNRRLTELVVTFQDVEIGRSVGTVGTVSSKFAVVVAVMAVGTEDARPGGAN